MPTISYGPTIENLFTTALEADMKFLMLNILYTCWITIELAMEHCFLIPVALIDIHQRIFCFNYLTTKEPQVSSKATRVAPVMTDPPPTSSTPLSPAPPPPQKKRRLTCDL